MIYISVIFQYEFFAKMLILASITIYYFFYLSSKYLFNIFIFISHDINHSLICIRKTIRVIDGKCQTIYSYSLYW